MKITVEPTAELFTLADGVEARVWRGATDKGVPLVAYIAVVSPTIPPDDPRQLEFVAELVESTAAVGAELDLHRRRLEPALANISIGLSPRTFDYRYFAEDDFREIDDDPDSLEIDDDVDEDDR